MWNEDSWPWPAVAGRTTRGQGETPRHISGGAYFDSAPHGRSEPIRRDRTTATSARLAGKPGSVEGGALPRRHAIDREAFDRLVEQAMVVELGGEVQKHPAEPDRRAVHEHEFPRHPHRPLFLQRAVDRKGLATAILRRLHAVGDGALAVVEQRPVDEPRPDVEDIHQLPRQPLEPPGLIGMDDEIAVAGQQAVVEVDDAADEFRREDADA